MAPVPDDSSTAELVYDAPAGVWTEALPIGNGRLGAMVHGGVRSELLQLNDDTFWSGRPRDWDVPGAKAAVEAARTAVLEGRPVEAGEALRGAQGPYVESYLPLADVRIAFDHGDDADAYVRRLDLGSGVAHASYRIGDRTYTRSAFASAPAGVLVLQLSCDRDESLGFRVDLDGPLATGPAEASSDELALVVKAPAHVEPAYLEDHPEPIVDDPRAGHGMYAAVSLRVLTDGDVEPTAGGLSVTNATHAALVVASATGFRGHASSPDRPADECLAEARARSLTASTRGAEALAREHVAEHRAWFGRAELTVPTSVEAPTTRELIRLAASDEDAALELARLLFHYGRYLLLASSRPGTQPANLQGIWNRHVRPPWSSNFTININTQMNYWPAEPIGLPELHEPLLSFVEQLAETGARTAERSYGLPGWVAHHNSDVWRHSMAVGAGSGGPEWANWWMGGAWLAHHLWDHYAYSLRREDLDRAYPVLRSASEFLLAWLVEDASGELVTAPSTSPENLFVAEDGRPASVSAAATMDLAVIAQVFDDTVAGATALGEDDALVQRLREARARLRRPGVGRYGELLEWAQEYAEVDPRHRHVSHLFGIFPGDVHLADPGLRDAAVRSLERRGDASTGWSRAWKTNLWARLGDGDRAFRLLRGFCSEATTEDAAEDGGIYPNLLCAHPPFQIDGNFGIASAICQMLLDSSLELMHLLPALPTAWHTGSVRGLRARGGFVVDISWADGALQQARIVSTVGRRCRVACGDLRAEWDAEPGSAYILDGRLNVAAAGA